jgi:hypothetical protein
MTGLKRKNGLPLREKSLRHRWDWKVQRPGLSPASTKNGYGFFGCAGAGCEAAGACCAGGCAAGDLAAGGALDGGAAGVVAGAVAGAAGVFAGAGFGAGFETFCKTEPPCSTP